VDGAVLRHLTLAAVLATAAGCGGAPVVERAAAPTAGELPDSAVAAIRLDRGRARRVGLFHGRGLWVAPTADGDTCLLDTATDAVGASCGPTLFGRHKLAFTEASDGGPPPRPLTLLRISGVAAPAVSSVVVELSDDSSTTLAPNGDGAFAYEEPAEQLAAGAVPVALDSRDGAARRVDRIDLPRAPFAP
jgi:hypothetical protein